MLKRILTFTLALIFVLSAAACNRNTQPDTSPSPSTSAAASPSPEVSATPEATPTVTYPAPPPSIEWPNLTPTEFEHTYPAQGASFDEFAESYLVEILLESTVNIHFYFKNPENYGFPEYEVNWGNGYLYPTESEKEYQSEMYRLLLNYNRNDLTEDQKVVYDCMRYDFELQDDYYDLYYYQEPLTSGIGQHVTIPLVLAEYKFQTRRDIEDYLHLLETLDYYIDTIIQFELEKSQRGLFMSDTSLDLILDECRDFAALKTDNSLITSFGANIAEITFDLTDEEIAAYTAKNTQAVEDVVLPAYQKLMNAIEALRGTGVSAVGLSGLPEGQRYVEYTLKAIGMSWDAETYISLLDSFAARAIEDYSYLIIEAGSNWNMIALEIDSLGFPNLTAEETLAKLQELAKTDFPALPEGTQYTIKRVDPSLEESARPAMYFSPQIDNAKENTITVNESKIKTSAAYFFTTLAHEGYPGHLQQFAGIMAQNVSPYRMVNSYSANSEGWATYAEYYAANYFEASEEAKAAYRLEQEWQLYLLARIEMGVCYEGWTLAEYDEFCMNNFYQTIGDDFYNYLVSAPLTYVMYAGGYMELLGLRDMFADLSDLEFHTAVLSAGSVPFSVMTTYLLDEYAAG